MDDASSVPTGTLDPGNKKTKNRCGVCGVRLPLTACHSLVCRCGGIYCSAHLHGGHACSFDHKAEARARLREAMPPIRFAKV